MKRLTPTVYLAVIGLLLLTAIIWYANSYITGAARPSFDGQRALEDVKQQAAFGPRTPGSAGHAALRNWLAAELDSAGWIVEERQARQLGHQVYNVVASRDRELPQIILGAHYDTRLIADQDPVVNRRSQPVPGANDGASGVAVLLGLARSLPEDAVPVWLVFFDAEDNGGIEDWDWILGSSAFVQSLSGPPTVAVIVDMVGDKDQQIYFERNSDPHFRAEIWDVAASMGHGDVFIAREKYAMLDDHTPFLTTGIPAVDIIDFDYPYWHTTMDTPDKVSAESLQTVGETLSSWIASMAR